MPDFLNVYTRPNGMPLVMWSLIVLFLQKKKKKFILAMRTTTVMLDSNKSHPITRVFLLLLMQLIVNLGFFVVDT